MLIVISPAKSLDYESKLPTKKHSEPQMLRHSKELVSVMAKKSPTDISKLMHVSASLGELNHERFQDWEMPFTTKNARPALLAFNGDVYSGMDPAGTFGERDYTHAQKTLRILSGLYGVLRPLDLMQPYRLEMGTSLTTTRGKDLYSFWGNEITDVLNNDLAASPGADALINGIQRVLRLGEGTRHRCSHCRPRIPRLKGRRQSQDRVVLRQAGTRSDVRLDHPRTNQLRESSQRVHGHGIPLRPRTFESRPASLHS